MQYQIIGMNKLCYYRDHVFTAMQILRKTGDELEMVVAEDLWPFHTFSDLLFGL